MATANPLRNVTKLSYELTGALALDLRAYCHPAYFRATTNIHTRPLPKNVTAGVMKKRTTKADREAAQEAANERAQALKPRIDLARLERRLRVEGLAYHQPWTRNESPQDASKRAETRLERAYVTLWALESMQPANFSDLLSLDAGTREAMKSTRPEMAVIVPHSKMRLRRGRRVVLPEHLLPTHPNLSAHLPAALNIAVPSVCARFRHQVKISTRTVKTWLRQLGQFDSRDTWRAVLDAINLEEAYRRNNEIHQNGFNKGGNQNEARDGEIRRMPVREHELIPETVQTKLDPGYDRIESLDGMLAKLLRESGEVEDLRTVQEASIAQSETFSHSDANELVPWNIARHIRSAPQSLQDAQVALQNYLGLETLEKDELNALNELENWVGVQESVASRERFYGSPEDPDFRERLFSVDRRQRSAPLLPSYAGCTAVLGDSVADLPVAEQWRLLYTLPAILTPLIEPEGCYVTTAVPGVGTSAALLARSLGAELRIINVDAKFHQDFRPFQRTVLNEMDAPFVPEHHEAAALVAMMSASRVFIVTDQPCTSPVMLNGELLHLPVKYAAALREAVTFRGACPNVTVIASKFHPGF